MVISHKAADLTAFLTAQNRSVGFVPTMGALHRGHRSLLAQAREDGHLTVVSIFVNPTQFNDKKDFEKYPITVDADILLLEEAGCDVLFLPDVNEIYPDGPGNMPAYDFGALEQVLEGAQRPGHFKGVGQVVARLLRIVRPQYLYMGQKDYQQCLVIRSLLQQTSMDEETELLICPTVREEDGLAMSSRNRRLSDPQRALAGIIYQCLVSIQSKHGDASFIVLQKECTELLSAKGFEVEYVSLADADNLEILSDFDASRKMVTLIAARMGATRLIDNLLL